MAWGKGPPSTIEEFVRRLAADDPALTSLAILRFRRCDADDARALAAALRSNTRLRELVAAQHRLPPAAYRAIALALAENARSGVASLSLGDGQLGDEGTEALVEGLLGRAAAEAEGDGSKRRREEQDATTTNINASLRHLDLEGRGLGPRAAAALAELLRHHRALEHLELGGNESLGDDGARALAAEAAAVAAAAGPRLPMITAAPLRRLSLQRCGITHEGVRALAGAGFCATLAELSLAENGDVRGREGGAALAALARASPRLRLLDARQTALGDEGVVAAVEGGLLAALLAAAAAACAAGEDEKEQPVPPSAVLDLTSTGLAAGGGCEALAAALASASGRSRLALRLGHNRDVPAEAVSRLASALAGGGEGSSTSAAVVVVEELDVGGAAVDAAAVRALAAVPGLRHLSLFSCASLGGAEEEQEASAAVRALCDALSSSSSSSFPALEHLGLAACGLNAAALAALLESTTSGAAASLSCLEIGGNPGVQDDAFEEAVNAARERRPSLNIAWRAGADGGGAEGGGGGAMPPALPPS